MTPQLLKNYWDARNAVFEHVGVSPTCSYSALSDDTDMNWFLNGKDDLIYWDDDLTAYHVSLSQLGGAGKFIAVGTEFSLVLADLGMGGDLDAKILLNSKQISELPKEVEDQI